MRIRPSGAGVVACLVGLLAAAVSGCGAAGAGAKAASAAPLPSAALSSSAASPSAPATPAPPAVLDAKTLNSTLLTIRDMPKDYVADSSATRYNGSAVPDDSPSAVPASRQCTVLDQTSWIRDSGVYTPDFAQADFVNSANTEEINEEVDAFEGSADTEQAMAGLWQAFGRCASFTETSSGVDAKITMTRSMIGGKWTGIKSVELSPAYIGGDTMVAIRVGYAIVTVFDTTESSNDGSAAVSMAEQIANRVKAAEAGQ
jgi:hypothetical protein